MTDPELDRALIDAAREAMGPSEADEERLLRRTMLAVGGAVATGAASASASAAASASAGGVVLAGTTVATWKLAALAAVGLVAVGGTAWQVSRPPAEHESASATSVARPAGLAPAVEAERSGQGRVALSPAAAEAPVEAVGADAPAPVPAHVEPPSPVTRTARPARHVAPERAETTASAPGVEEAGRLGAEAALLRSAHRALREGQPSEALRLLDQHASDFPGGVLVQERTATRVLALCESGQAFQARRVANAFLARHPDSIQAARIRASCAGAD